MPKFPRPRRRVGARIDRLVEAIRAVRQDPDADGDAIRRLREALRGD